MTKHSQKIATTNGPRLPIWLPLIAVAGVVVIAVAAITTTSAPANFAPEVQGAPALKVDKEKVDLGNVKLGQTVSVSFDVTNVGDQPLRFKQKPYVEVVEGC